MKTLARLASSVLIIGFLPSCTSSASTLKPGDKINGMELTTSFDRNIHELCSFDSLFEGMCVIPVSAAPIGVSTGWSEDTLEALELAWSESEWKMTIDGQEVHLPSFGTFDLPFGGQQARVWDVGLLNLSPGQHTVRYEFYLGNGSQPGNHTQVYAFTVEAP